ncbi:MAG: sulfur oxidation c-type cytochrome SoxA [Burkholderiaceae bacterium]|nr:sulfur oxidation c-type cytochrome SoxA [Burkholderiaceae bacterium]
MGLGRLFFVLSMITLAGLAAAQARRSGFDDMSPASRAMQADDSANPGMLSVLEGASLWRQTAGNARRACADCHGEPARMKGVALRYPNYDPATDAPMNLDQRINACRVRWQQAPALDWESRELLSLGALIGHQSRGLAIETAQDPRLAPFRERGRQRFEQRIGQLNFSCRDCHDTLAGRRLGASTIPQGHPTGYPIYRLEWQALGSLQRRLRNCMTGVRAEPHPFGSIAHLELELHLQSRAAGMVLETPAVRP